MIRLTEEALARPVNCEPSAPPFVGLNLTAGREDAEEPELEFYVSFEREHLENLDVWALRWSNEDGLYVRLMFLEVGRALDILKCLLDKKTGQWASLVPFK